MNKKYWRKANVVLFAFMGLSAILADNLDIYTRIMVLMIAAIFFYTRYRGAKSSAQNSRKG